MVLLLHLVRLFFGSDTTKFGSTFKLCPIPSHSSQAPKGELNENNLGSISSIVKPLSGHENFEEKVMLSSFLNFLGNVSFSYSTTNNPFDRFTAVSTLSASLFPNFEFRIILSTTIEISCFSFLFKFGKSSILNIYHQLLILEKPLFLNLKFLFYILLFYLSL